MRITKTAHPLKPPYAVDEAGTGKDPPEAYRVQGNLAKFC